MTEQELIEKIAIEGATTCFTLWKKLSGGEKDNWRNWAERKILPIVKEALPELAKKAGYVKLADDQNLPALPLFRWIGYGEERTARLAYEAAQQDMLKQGWKKVVARQAGGK